MRIPAGESSARARLINDRAPDKYTTHPDIEPLKSPGLCVRIGDGDWQLLARGATLEVPAHASALQRWEIDGGDYLIHIPPGRTLTLADCELCGWRFVGPELGTEIDRFCAAMNCPDHQVAFLRDREASCVEPQSIERTRCKARPKVRFSSVAHPKTTAPAPMRMHPDIDHEEAATNMSVWASPHREEWLIVQEQPGQLVSVDGQWTKVPGHLVTLATGVGEEWTVWLDGDRLVGIAQ